MKKLDITYSQFWLDDNAKQLISSGNEMDVFQLAKYRRAISNFVFILTGKNIPVRFVEKRVSFTDNKSIQIGGDLSQGEFDATVGLSCHEASHIIFGKYFELVKTLWQHLPNDIYKSSKDKLHKSSIVNLASEIYNWVEDRFIDDFVYRTAPGYRGYYEALYEKYFYSQKITRALQSDAYRRNDVLSYRFRLINLLNPKSDLDALPGLREIHELLDIPQISRLKLPEDRLVMAYDIVRIVVQNIIEQDEELEKSGECKNSDGDGESADDETNDTDDGNAEMSGADRLDGGNVPQDPEESGMPEKQLDDVAKDFERQQQFLSGKVSKTALDQSTSDKLAILDESGADLISVGGSNGVPKIECITVKRLTWRLLTSDTFPFSQQCGSSFTSNRTGPRGLSSELLPHPDAIDAVRDGTQLGVALGRKLQVRGESRTTKTPRQNTGKLDRRLLSELGFGNERIFYTISTDSYKRAHLHLSVDASSSMLSKWKRTMTVVVMLAKACSMVNNLEIVISLRSTSISTNGELIRPYTVICYDSRVEKFSKVTQFFPYLYPSGWTPEGLSFESILPSIPRSDDQLDCYFLNISDGEPQFQSKNVTGGQQYSGIVAWDHTRRQIDKIRAMNVEVLSYFIEESIFIDSPRVDKNMAAFRRMYGKDAQLIDVESVMQIAKTMNKLFMRKAEDS